MRPSSIVLPLLAIALLAGPPSRASACTCAPTDFTAAYSASDVILLGEVLGVESAAPEYPEAVRVTIRVEEAWKGATPAEAQVLTGVSGGMCGYTFQPGERYLVYASMYDPDLPSGPLAASLWTGLCGRTHTYWAEDPDLVALRATRLSHGFPNPSPGAVEFALDVSKESQLSWAVFDPQGRMVWSEERMVGPGRTYLRWDGMTSSRDPAASGVYLIRASVDGTRFNRRVVRF